MTKALILAGGLGTRLRPLTYTRPKPLLPIANRPHLEHVLDLLQRHGIDDVVLLTSYLADAFESLRSGAQRRGMTVGVTHEPEPLGTGGALKNAASFIGDEPFLAFNGDVLTDVDLGAVLDFHRERHAQATMLLTPVDDPSTYGVVTTDERGTVTDFIEKPPKDQAPSNLINAGVYVLEPGVIDRIPSGRAVSSEHEIFPDLVREAALVALTTDAYWNEIGDPAKYLRANLDALEGRFHTDAISSMRADRVLAADGVEIAGSAQVSSTCLGRDVRVGAGVVIRDSVLLAGVEIAEGSHIEGCVLGEGVYVGADTRLSGETLGDEERVGG
jgi:NDP-sugar pyrophosphorylase family protein